tara:strand:- start:670 stop:1221 length:552 start_codon:yes stop_codon:yes gene_type:complete
MKEISCKETCKMTLEMRNSKYCTGKASILDGKIFYGCKELIAKEPLEVKQLMSCEIWDAGVRDSCNTCSLKCVNNKNPNMKKTRLERERLERLIEELKPNMVLYSVTPDEIEKISAKYTEKNSKGEVSKAGSEAISAANIANYALKKALEGRPVDPAMLSLYIRRASSRIKKAAAAKKKQNDD